jgi:hypothetical protein
MNLEKIRARLNRLNHDEEGCLFIPEDFFYLVTSTAEYLLNKNEIQSAKEKSQEDRYIPSRFISIETFCNTYPCPSEASLRRYCQNGKILSMKIGNTWFVHKKEALKCFKTIDRYKKRLARFK